MPDDGGSLLDSLREQIGCRAPKDGCSPQGQCGCCTVWIDGVPRVSCVTPTRRVAGREVTTTDGLPCEVRQRWAAAFVAAGASQCGFCTPGIVMRLAALGARPDRAEPAGTAPGAPSGAGARGPGAPSPASRRPVDEAAVRSALLAHLCRCTGWQTVVEAACDVLGIAAPGTVGHSVVTREPGGFDDVSAETSPGAAPVWGNGRDPLLAAWRAQIEGPAYQSSGPETVMGSGGFADDTAPRGALAAVPGEDGSTVVGPNLAAARSRSGKVQGRRSTVGLSHPLGLPEGEWALTLQTTWVEPAYLEPDASWCAPGGRPAPPLANGGAFGGKRRSPVPAQAAALSAERGLPVRVVWSREDVVRRGPKRPPVALAVRADGSGVMRVARGGGDGAGGRELEALVDRVSTVAPGLLVEQVDVAGPPTSADLRGAGWAEAAVAMAALAARGEGREGPGTEVEIVGLSGGRAQAVVGLDGTVSVGCWAGEVLDEVVLRSYCIGAAHQALSWVRSEGIAVDGEGEVQDLTIRSFGILSARDTPRVEVALHRSDRWPVNGSDAVFAAVAAAAWLADGLPPRWPTRRRRPSLGATAEHSGPPVATAEHAGSRGRTAPVVG